MAAEPNPTLMAVLVVYERNLPEAASWSRLRTWLEPASGAEAARGALGHLLIYDNSGRPRAVPPLGLGRCEYAHNPANGGTAAAYQFAVRRATELGIEWLLLVDHDTKLPETFLAAVIEAISKVRHLPEVVALAPRVMHAGHRVVSPTRVTAWGTFRPLGANDRRGAGAHVSAVASGSVLRVAALQPLFPLPAGLWLDYVDHWIFAELNRRNLTIMQLDQRLEHDLSVAVPELLSPRRLLSVLEGEAIFHRLLGVRARMVYPWRLLWRVLRLAAVAPGLALQAVKWIAARGRRGR